IAIEPGRPNGNGAPAGSCYGWEVADAAALDSAAGDLEAAGVIVTEGTKAELEARRVAGMIHCLDPAGHRVELFCGADSGDGEFGCGWGGYLVDDASWEPCELSAVSSWGHIPA